MNGEYFADRLRAAARGNNVSLHKFLMPLTRNSAAYIAALAMAKAPRPHTIARIEALIAGEAMPELHRQILIDVPHSVWCRIDAEARRKRQKLAELAAEIVVIAADRLQ